jgi:hypothetical protein
MFRDMRSGPLWVALALQVAAVVTAAMTDYDRVASRMGALAAVSVAMLFDSIRAIRRQDRDGE